MKSAGIPLVIALALFLASCGIPMSRTSVVPEGVAKNPEQLATKLEELKKNHMGADVTEVMKFLNIKPKTPGVRDIIDAKEKKEILYTGFELRGSPEEAEQFRKRLEKHNIKEIVFSEVSKKLSLDSPISTLITKEGPSFLAHLIFFENKLIEIRMPENFQTKEKTRSYITDLISGVWSGGVSQGLKQIK